MNFFELFELFELFNFFLKNVFLSFSLFLIFFFFSVCLFFLVSFFSFFFSFVSIFLFLKNKNACVLDIDDVTTDGSLLGTAGKLGACGTSGTNLIGGRATTQTWNSLMPLQLWTESDDEKRSRRMNIKLALALEPACGSIPMQCYRRGQRI